VVGGDWHRAPEISGPVRTSRPARSEPGRKNHGPAAAQRSFVSRDVHHRGRGTIGAPFSQSSPELDCIVPSNVGGRCALARLRDEARAPAIIRRSGASLLDAQGDASTLIPVRTILSKGTGRVQSCRVFSRSKGRTVTPFSPVRNDDNHGKSPACLPERRTISAAPRRRCGRRRPRRPPVRCLIHLLFSLSPWSATPNKLRRMHCCRVFPPCRISIRSTRPRRGRWGHVIVPSTPDSRDRRPMLYLGLAPAPRRRLASPGPNRSAAHDLGVGAVVVVAASKASGTSRTRRASVPSGRACTGGLADQINPHPRGRHTMMDTTMY
jgi:hypothetical protein